MKIYTKQIDDRDIVQLLDLYCKYTYSIGIFSKYKTMTVLTKNLVRDGSIAFGLYRNEELIGFTLGWKKNDVCFYYDALYILPKYRIYIKRLYIASEDFIHNLGYSFWEAFGNKKHTISLHKRMGAKAVSIQKDSIKFIKEI